jgi:chromosome segregation ATPase
MEQLVEVTAQQVLEMEAVIEAKDEDLLSHKARLASSEASVAWMATQRDTFRAELEELTAVNEKQQSTIASTSEETQRLESALAASDARCESKQAKLAAAMKDLTAAHIETTQLSQVTLV